jgi:hypothetical protein
VRLSSVLVIVHTTMSYNADMKYSSTWASKKGI